MGFEENEYKEIWENFTKLDHLSDLLSEITLDTRNELVKGLNVTWLEGGQDRVNVNESGWFVFNEETKDCYPTFESLAMKKSPLFCLKWREALFAKLGELDDDEKLNTER